MDSVGINNPSVSTVNGTENFQTTATWKVSNINFVGYNYNAQINPIHHQETVITSRR